MFFNFLSRVFIARFYTPADYGLFNLYFTILSIFAAVGVIGLRNGIQRNISYYLGKDEKDKVPAIIGWGLTIALAGGIIFGLFLFVFANPIASLFSEDPVLGDYYRLAAIAVPFYIFTIALISVFRGFQRTKEKILFYDVGRNTLMLAFIFTMGFLTLPFRNVILSVTISVILISIAFFIYYLKNRKKTLGIKRAFRWDVSVRKKLLLFSLPLLLVDITGRVTGWTDTMMIGFFMTEDYVGYYQAAKPMTHFIKTALSVTIFIYSPLAAYFYAQKKVRENKAIFTVLTKWICFASLPIALTFILYPSWILDFFFGTDYVAAVIPLQILAIIYFIKVLMGPNGATLTAYGKTKFLMYVTVALAVLNIILNGILIPYFGIIGAAAATGLSKLSLDVIRVKKLKDISGIHSIRPEIITPTALSALLSTIIVALLRYVFPVSIFLIMVSAVLFYVIFLLTMIFTKSLSQDDIKLILLIEKRLGLDLTRVKDFLSKFT